jgi:hypothetical protein
MRRGKSLGFVVVCGVAMAILATSAAAVTPTPDIFRMVLPFPNSNPLPLSWGQELVRRLQTYAFCDPASGCGGGGIVGPTNTPGPSPTPGSTNTVTVTAAATPTSTATGTVTPTPTFLFDWAVFHPSTGSNIAATVFGDTANFTCSPPLICTGDGNHTITWALATATPTATPTITSTATITNTPISTATPSSTPTNTGTVTNTPTVTATWTLPAPADASYVVVSNTSALSAERAAAATSPITLTDAGANSTLTWAWDFSVANTWTGQQVFNSAATLSSNTSVTDVFFNNATASAAIGVIGLFEGGKLTSSSTIQAYYEGFVDNIANVNSSSVSTTWILGYAFEDEGTYTADTTSDTLGTHYSFYSVPTYGTANSGALTVTTASGFASAPIVNSGATITTRYGMTIGDVTGVGAVTTNVGINIANLTKGGTNWSMQIGSAQSYHVGKIMFGGTSAPAEDMDFDGQANKEVRVIRETTASTAGNTLRLQAGGAVSGGTNINGGKLDLHSGIATGNGSSFIEFGAVQKNQGTGTTDRNPAPIMYMLDGHIESTNTQPVVSVCGTPGPTPIGTDQSFSLTTGTGTFTACTITFGKSFTNAPMCTCLATSNKPVWITSASASAITITSTSSFASITQYCNCFGRQ